MKGKTLLCLARLANADAKAGILAQFQCPAFASSFPFFFKFHGLGR
jgi:hypothetical protein